MTSNAEVCPAIETPLTRSERAVIALALTCLSQAPLPLVALSFVLSLARAGKFHASGPGLQSVSALCPGTLRTLLERVQVSLPNDNVAILCLLAKCDRDLEILLKAGISLSRLSPLESYARCCLVQGQVERNEQRLQNDGHLESLSPAETQTALQREVATTRARRLAGRYYTDPDLARRSVELTLPPLLETTHPRRLRVLDLATGTGIFLRESALLLAKKLQEIEVIPASEAMAAIVSECLYGLDLEPEPLQVARWELLYLCRESASLPDLGNRVFRADAVVGSTRKTLPWPSNAVHSLSPEVLHSLLDAWTCAALDGAPATSVWPAPGSDPLAWLEQVQTQGRLENARSRARAEGFLHPEVHFMAVPQGFDAVVGNPPYVSEVRGGHALFARLRLNPRTRDECVAKGDLFYHFMREGIRLLHPGGRLGMIVPPYWRTRHSAARLREQLAQATRPISQVSFGENRMFGEARGHHSEIVVLESRPELSDDVPSAPVSQRQIQTSRHAEVQRDDGLAEQLLTHRCPVWHLSETSICQGVVLPQATLNRAGLAQLPPNTAQLGDGIFWLRDSEILRLELNTFEQQQVGPYLPVGAMTPFCSGNPMGWLLCLTPEVARILRTQPELAPHLVAHLTRFSPAITSANGPFGLHRARSREWFQRANRIGVVRKTPQMKAARLPQHCFVDQGFNIVQLESEADCLFVLGLLHSPRVDAWLRRFRSQGMLLQVDKDALMSLPLPQVTPMEAAQREALLLRWAQTPATSPVSTLLQQGLAAARQEIEGGLQVTRVAVEALVLFLESLSTQLQGLDEQILDARHARPGRGGRFFRRRHAESHLWKEAMQSLARLVHALYGEHG